MNPQSTWLHTLIEACGAHLLILALATAISLLHGPQADAGGLAGPRAERIADREVVGELVVGKGEPSQDFDFALPRVRRVERLFFPPSTTARLRDS